MQSRRDHIQAYQFSTSRLVHAATSGDTGVGDIPFRRARFGTILGAALAVLLGGGAFVYGLISPAPNMSWLKPGTIIVEQETGTRYLLVGGVLRPVSNLASARLLAGPTAPVQIVQHKLLVPLRIGAAIGIPGAPDVLPAAGTLQPGLWALCAKPGSDGKKMVLDLAPDVNAHQVPAHRRLLVAVAGADGKAASEYVLWDGMKYPVPDPAVLPALGLGNVTPLPVTGLWLAEFPIGAALAMAPIPSAGSQGPRIAGQPTRVGQVFQVNAGGVDQFYVLRGDGLAPLTATEAALFSVAGDAVPQARVLPSAIAAVPASADTSLLHRLPDILSGPAYIRDGDVVCALQESPPDPSAPSAPATHSPASAPGTTGLVVEPAARLAAGPDVLLPHGGAMLVELPPTSNDPLAEKPPSYLITGGGLKYFLNGTDAVRGLGFGNVLAQLMPQQILSMIPSGPELSVVRAEKAVPWGSG
jgi:type VII secretion protein EccB